MIDRHQEEKFPFFVSALFLLLLLVLNCLNPAMFQENFAQDVDATEADIMAIVQKPFHGSIFTAKSGPPAWKQLPTSYQISTSDLMIPPDVQQKFAKQMNPTTISIHASHASYGDSGLEEHSLN